MSNQLSREETLFHAALALPTPAGRADYLRQACASDEPLRQRVEALLRAAAGGDFLEPPTAVATATPTVRLTVPISEKPGDRIGHYKLLERLGEGGCGVVYMADQTEPIRRRVALKVVKLGMDTKDVIARFEAERQALALMDHPNIAKVFDAGATSTGRPYFVMELVRGISITDYCDQNNLTTSTRLDLFMKVCQAVQHAHQKGIIHRDLKPSNILVTLHDGVPVPKVIDFGIAKATAQQPLTDKTLFTAFQQFIGTPAYMSPEQAEMSGLDIDTRSDIYSLGVLLYELLTGRPPFAHKELIQAGFDEMRRLIREREPAKPSTCLSTLAAADLTSVAKHRHAEPPKLVSLVRGDLDWIVMKCLEKDRTRRYETANALALDLERHLSDEPVFAAAPGVTYRVQKFARRHRAGIAVSVAFVGLLIASTVVSTWQAVRATRAEQRTKLEAAKNEVVARFMAEVWEALKPLLPQTANLSRLIAVIDRTTLNASEKLRSDPEAHVELMELAGGAYLELGLSEQGKDLLGAALEARKKKSGPDSLEVANLLNNYGYILNRRGDHAQSEKLLGDALAIARKHPVGTNSIHSAILFNLSESLGAQGKWADAAGILGQAIQLIPSEHVFWAWRAPVLLQAGDLEGYRRHCQAALERFASSTNVPVSDRVIRGYLLTPSSGPTLELVGRVAETNLAARLGQNSEAYYQLTLALANLRRGRPAEAATLARQVIGQPITKDSTQRLYPRDVSGYMVLAMALQQMNRTDEARAALAQGLELASQNLPAIGNSNLGRNWWETLMAHINLREARALIEKTPPQ